MEFFPTPEGYYDARTSRYVYQYADHLGNTRLSYSDINNNNVIENNEILSEADYYPFGLQHTENSIATTANKAAEKYQYNGKEFQDELNLNVFDYGARNYDAAIGRWFNHDPLSEVTLDPYGYTYNNPINLIDPTGMAASPIYDEEDGSFLGTDDKGFEGEILFMNRTTFSVNGGYNNGTDNSKKGGISHKVAKQFGKTLSQVIGDNPQETFTQKEIESVNNAITHVVSQMGDYGNSLRNLHNGKTSSSYYEMPQLDGSSAIWKTSNNGRNLGGAFPALASIYKTGNSSGSRLVTHNLKEFSFFGLTVENLQNTWVHEYGNHYLLNIPGGSNNEHARALYNQSVHTTWKNTTQSFKNNIRDVYYNYTGSKLGR